MWRPDWPPEGPASPSPDVAGLLETAEGLAAAADSRDDLLAAMGAYSRVLDRDPYQQQALSALANLNILMGAAHIDGRQGKNAHFLRAMRLCERAMYANPSFKHLADQGMAPWQACRALGKRDIPVMMFWTTAVLYMFKEVFTFPEQVVNLDWVEHTGPMLRQLEALDPTWGGGAIQFTRSLYFGILPRVLGGDADRSRLSLEQAVAFGSPWMLSRWGRAKYFHVRDRNRQGFEEDLRWVLSQDVALPGEAYSWRVYFKQDAAAMLENADRYF